ncbi:MAG: replication-associated recombination protein A [Gammaproteobacteria bacterium]
MRPRNLDEYAGQTHVLGPGKPLRQAIEGGRIHSMILWGPPGTGKTTLARLVAGYLDAEFLTLSAVLGGVKDIRAAVDKARAAQSMGRRSVLFVDEVHRFNKAQQDAFLPHVEDGTVTFIGATTENPSFELNNALLSRARTYVLKSLDDNELGHVVDAALHDQQRGLGSRGITLEPDARAILVAAADGDARRALTLLEIASDLAEGATIGRAAVEAVAAHGTRRFDKGGDAFYDQISALHKAVRGSDPDAALYWLARMIDGGCDPRYVNRRIVRMASEDIGNADPRALEITLNAARTFERLGAPEGELAIAQAVAYLACAAKSNAVYTAWKAAQSDARERGSLEVPMHLRNAPTRLMKELGHGKDYRYAHDEPDAYASGENYFPEGMEGTRYYQPVERGLEIKIAEKLRRLRGEGA